jgi:hypothetical protein
MTIEAERDDAIAQLHIALASLGHNQGVVETLEAALAESVNLQSHYAMILNGYDGGKRMVFKNSDEWIARLRDIGAIGNKSVQIYGTPDSLPPMPQG